MGRRRDRRQFFYGLIQTQASAAAAGAAIIRQADISLCLMDTELDELRQIQNAINRRRPRTAELKDWMRPTPRHQPPFFGRLVRGN